MIHDSVMYVTGSYSRMWAIDIATGEIKRHYQTTPHDGWDYDGWDYDGVNELVNFDMGQDGEQWVAIVTGWGGAVPLWGGDVAAIVKDFNQDGSVWAFKIS